MLNEIIKGISMALNAAFGDGYEIYQNDVEQGLKEIFCENWQNPVKQRITPHFLTTSPSNYYEFTTKE